MSTFNHTDRINRLHDRVLKLDKSIAENELTIDHAMKMLESQREARTSTLRQIERLIIGDAVEYPSYIDIAEAA